MNVPEDMAWVILLLPLCAVVGITFFAFPNRERSARYSIAAVVVSFVLSFILFFLLRGDPPASATPWTWLNVSGLKVVFAPRLDALSLLMLLVVTGVGSAIHIYSWGYMMEEDDRGVARYFAGLSLFTFAMLGIVLANHFVVLFIFWELVGLSSYLLIGFWFQRPGAADAAKKAFLTNRLGDFGFLLGLLFVWSMAGTLEFTALQERFRDNPEVLGGMATLVGLLIFCGAMGKSAQFPLHVWLPDAMEGPTPVSALIHAATMVAAGVFMLCRVFFLLNAPALEVIAWVGGFTAVLSALMATQQNDIKRILAYSTLSQLGLMIMAVGLARPGPAMYHLVTHAGFKALLFLGAGSVIHAVAHEQDIWRMGGLKRGMPVTFWTFLLATLALCGVPPLSGFFSKDEILAAAADRNLGLFVVALLVTLLTTFYMFRLVFVAFCGRERSAAAEQARESPKIMTWPLVLLAAPTVVGGLWGIGHYLKRFFHPETPGLAEGGLSHLLAAMGHSPLAAAFGLGAIGFGFSLAWTCYWNADRDPLPARMGMLARVVRDRFYLDAIYAVLIRSTQDALAWLADWMDRWVIAGVLVRGTHGTTEFVGRALRLVQTGNLQTYVFLCVAGLVVVLLLTLRR